MRSAALLLGSCLALALSTANARAQSCCGKLDVPLAGTERAHNNAGQLLLGLSYELGLSDNGFIEQGFGIQSAQTHSWALDVSYGVTPWFTPGFAMPLIYKHYGALVDGEAVVRESTGVGDAVLLAKFAILGARPMMAPGSFRLWLAPGVKLPTGSYDDDDEYGRLPASAQPGSGSFDGVAAAFASIGLDGAPGRVLLVANAVARLTTENSDGFRAGHAFEGGLFVTLALIDRLSLRAGPQLRFGMRDRQAGIQLANTGALRLSARVGAAYSIDETWAITGDVQAPIYSRVHGNQLDPQFATTLGLLVSYP